PKGIAMNTPTQGVRMTEHTNKQFDAYGWHAAALIVALAAVLASAIAALLPGARRGGVKG
ncbi:hypothetical protein LPZ50_21265, partial [Bordetella petrii]|nr:hypothetical protein [Bordetella petrii]